MTRDRLSNVALEPIKGVSNFVRSHTILFQTEPRSSHQVLGHALALFPRDLSVPTSLTLLPGSQPSELGEMMTQFGRRIAPARRLYADPDDPGSNRSYGLHHRRCGFDITVADPPHLDETGLTHPRVLLLRVKPHAGPDPPHVSRCGQFSEPHPQVSIHRQVETSVQAPNRPIKVRSPEGGTLRYEVVIVEPNKSVPTVLTLVFDSHAVALIHRESP